MSAYERIKIFFERRRLKSRMKASVPREGKEQQSGREAAEKQQRKRGQGQLRKQMSDTPPGTTYCGLCTQFRYRGENKRGMASRGYKVQKKVTQKKIKNHITDSKARTIIRPRQAD